MKNVISLKVRILGSNPGGIHSLKSTGSRDNSESNTAEALASNRKQSQSINKVPTRFDVYIKGNRNDFFATRGADIAILTGFGEHLFTKVHGFISNN
jgi:hypothetical protein